MGHRGFWGTFAVLFVKFTLLLFVVSELVFFFLGVVAVLAGESSPFIEWLFIMLIISPTIAIFSMGGGLLFGLTSASIYKALTISVTFQNRDTYLLQLNTAVNELGFRLESQSQNKIIYKRTGFRERIVNPKISVQMDKNSATIVGPAMYIKKLRSLLRN